MFTVFRGYGEFSAPACNELFSTHGPAAQEEDFTSRSIAMLFPLLNRWRDFGVEYGVVPHGMLR